MSKGPASSHLSYHLVYKSLEGYAILLGRKLEHHASEAEYTLRGCMYNTASRGFIGRFHTSLPFGLVESLQGGAVICPINQASFFFCHHEDTSHILVMELTAKYLESDEEMKEVCLGWSMFPVLLNSGKQGVAKSAFGAKKTTDNSVRLAVYEGTPRALFSLSHPTSECSSLVPIPGCILTVVVSSYPTLARAVHLLPPSTLISLDDVIPGLMPTKVLEAFPKLMKCSSCTLEKLSLLLLPSVDDFEDQLLANLSEDLNSEGSGVDDSSPIKIEERRLKVMIYNGWRYVGSPAIGFLEKAVPSSKSYGLRSTLLLKGSLELSSVPSHPLLEIVTQLEYVVSWKSNASLSAATARGTQSAKPSSFHTTSLSLGWAVYQPFNSDPTSSVMLDEDSLLHQPSLKQVTLEMKSGPGFQPTVIPFSAHTACYKGNLNDVGKVTFRFVPSKLSGRVEGSQLLYGSSMSNVVLEDTLTPLRRPLSRSTPEPSKQSRTVDEEASSRRSLSTSTPVRRGVVGSDSQPSEPAPLHPLPVEVRQEYSSQFSTPHHSTTSLSPIPRSILAYFHHSGLEDFKDSKGHSLPQVTSSSQLPASNVNDALQQGPYQIGIQPLGFQFSDAQSSDSMATRSLSSLLLELHFHHFPATALHCTLTPPPNHSMQFPHLITSSTQATCVHQFPVHLQSLPSRTDRSRFAAFLQHGHLMVDVYDGNSLILLGVVTVPLVGLIVPAESAESATTCSYFQQSLLCPVLFYDSNVGCLDALSSSSVQSGQRGQLPPRMIGQLFLRLARLPPGSEDFNHTSKPRVTVIKPDKPSVHIARRLYGGQTPWRGDEQVDEDEPTKQRKQSRMNSVRELRLKRQMGESAVPHSQTVSAIPRQSSIVDVQREELKRDRINCVLQESLTSHYLVHPQLGRALYLEHTFTNSFNHPLSVSIAWNDSDLKLVSDKKECEYLREAHSINKAEDVCLVSEGKDGGHYGFFVHPGEIVSLPFKYQCFSTTSGSHDDTLVMEGDKKEDGDNKIIKVYLQAAHQELVGIIEIHVEPQPQRVDHIFHLYHPERTYLKKVIDVDIHHPLFLLNSNLETISGRATNRPGQLFACTSDPTVTCEVRSMENSASVFFKSLVKPVPAVHTFYIFIYTHAYLLSPGEIWRVVVHSASKVSHSLTLGQSSAVNLAVRGDHVHRKVSCYSYNAPVMMVVAPSPFLLNSHSLHEVHLSVKTLSSEASSVLVSAVDVEKRHLLGLWMLAITVQEPEITRAFQIALPAGVDCGVSEKSITFTNSYSQAKEYILSTDRPDIIHFKDNVANLQPQETTVLSLLFQPSLHAQSVNVLVFINDCSDQIEECFLIKIDYS